MSRIKATVLATALAAGVIGTVVAATAVSASASGEKPPVCTWVSITQNSGNGPDYRVQMCGPVFGQEREDGVKCIVDGSKWGPKAVSFCRFGREDDPAQG